MIHANQIIIMNDFDLIKIYKDEFQTKLKAYEMKLDHRIHSKLCESHVSILKSKGVIKLLLNDYKGSLKDLDDAKLLTSNKFFIFINGGKVKLWLHDYKGFLKDLNYAYKTTMVKNLYILSTKGQVQFFYYTITKEP